MSEIKFPLTRVQRYFFFKLMLENYPSKVFKSDADMKKTTWPKKVAFG